MKSKDIFFFIPFLNSGGAERVTLKLFNGLSEKNKNIYLLTLRSGGELESLIKRRSRVKHIGSNSVLFSFFKMVKFFYNNDAVVFSVMTQSSILLLFVKFALKILGRDLKVICVEHSYFPSWGKILGYKKHAFYGFLIKVLYPYANYIVAVSLDIALFFRQIFPDVGDKVVCIYNPIFDTDIQKLKTAYLEHNFFSGNTKKVGYIGRLSSEKNVQLLIRSFHSLLNMGGSDCELIIVGDGHERGKLIELVNELNIVDKVRFIGNLNNPYPVINALDVLVLTSLVEGFPSVLVEAMSLGVPVVSINCKTGPREIITSDSVGLLVESYNPQDFADAIYSVINDRRFDKEIIIDSAARFSTEKSLSNYAELIAAIEKE